MSQPTRLVALCTVAAVAVTGLTAGAATTFVESWSDGTAGPWLPGSLWTTVDVVASGGNPGGWLHSATVPSQSGFYAGIWTDAAKFRGDYAATGVDEVGADVRIVSGAPVSVYFRLRESAAVNGWGYEIPTESLSSDWSTFVAPIDVTWTDAEAMAAGWVPEGGSVPGWQATVTSVDSFSIRALGAAALEMGYDNVRIHSTIPCDADVDGDGLVDATDLGMLLAAWGPCAGCDADLDADGIVTPADLALLLAGWGPCGD